MDWGKLLLYNSLPGLLIAILGFVITRYIGQINKRLDGLESRVTSNHKLSLERIFELTDKVGDVLDTMLTKFSQWEDRIMRRIRLEVHDGPKDQKEYDLDKELEKFSAESKTELTFLKDQMNKILKDIGEIEGKLDDREEKILKRQLELLSKKLAKIKAHTEVLNNHIINRIDASDRNVRQMFKIMTKFTKELKYVKGQLEIVKEMKSSKIVLK